MGPSGLNNTPSLRLSGILFGMVLLLCALIPAGCIPPSQRIRLANDSTGLLRRVYDMRISGADGENTPPILLMSDRGEIMPGPGGKALTLRFELHSERVPNLVLQLVHCDRNWRPTENAFVQDPVRLRSNEFQIEYSPLGVRTYTHQVSITFPGSSSFFRIQHSGHYLARVLDYDDPSQKLGEVRFFVVETRSAVGLSIISDFYRSGQTDLSQQGWKILAEAETAAGLFGTQVAGIELYQSGQWYDGVRAGPFGDAMEFTPGQPTIRWSNSIGKIYATFSNIPAGNEHRILDLTDVLYYPTTGGVISTPLSDQIRRGFDLYDNDGYAITRPVPASDADFVPFEFRLDLQGYEVDKDIFVVGTFNNWRILPEWQLRFDPESRSYKARGLLRRAVHEYEYRAGTWDSATATLKGADASLLEGNVRKASPLYYAFVVYAETASGGYDRLVGVGSSSIRE